MRPKQTAGMQQLSLPQLSLRNLPGPGQVIGRRPRHHCFQLVLRECVGRACCASAFAASLARPAGMSASLSADEARSLVKALKVGAVSVFVLLRLASWGRRWLQGSTASTSPPRAALVLEGNLLALLLGLCSCLPNTQHSSFCTLSAGQQLDPRHTAKRLTLPRCVLLCAHRRQSGRSSGRQASARWRSSRPSRHQ
jgi:hypothetical protein